MIAAIYVFLIHPWIENALAWFSGNLAFSFVIGFFYGIFAIDVCYSFNLVAKIRNVAVEYNMQVRYEEFKEHIRKETEVRRTKYRFLLPFRSEKSVAEHLKEYFEEKKSADGSLKEHIKKLTPKKKRGKSENK